MPYVICARCSLRTYSAALWTSIEVCPSCGTELPRRRDTLVPISVHPRFAARSKGPQAPGSLDDDTPMTPEAP